MALIVGDRERDTKATPAWAILPGYPLLRMFSTCYNPNNEGRLSAFGAVTRGVSFRGTGGVVPWDKWVSFRGTLLSITWLILNTYRVFHTPIQGLYNVRILDVYNSVYSSRA